MSITIEEFHASYDGAKPAYEYWHGAAIQKAMPTALYGIVQMLIGTLLDNAGWNAAPEVRLKVSSDISSLKSVRKFTPFQPFCRLTMGRS